MRSAALSAMSFGSRVQRQACNSVSLGKRNQEEYMCCPHKDIMVTAQDLFIPFGGFTKSIWAGAGWVKHLRYASHSYLTNTSCDKRTNALWRDTQPEVATWYSALASVLIVADSGFLRV